MGVSMQAQKIVPGRDTRVFVAGLSQFMICGHSSMKPKVAILAIILSAIPARAQFIGYVSGQTTQQKVFTAKASNGQSVTLTNLGNASHFLSYCNTGFIGTISLLASPDGTFSQPITLATASYGLGNSPAAPDSACHVIQAGGYFPTVRAAITNYALGSMNAWYSATGLPIGFQPPGLASTGPASAVACDRTFASFVASGQNGVALITNGIPAGSYYVCQMTLSFDAATTAGIIQLGDSVNTDCSGGAFPPANRVWELAVTATTPQTLTFGGGSGSFLRSITAGHCLVITTGTVTANVYIDLSYALF